MTCTFSLPFNFTIFSWRNFQTLLPGKIDGTVTQYYWLYDDVTFVYICFNVYMHVHLFFYFFIYLTFYISILWSVYIIFGGFENITIWQRFSLAILLEESYFFHLVTTNFSNFFNSPISPNKSWPIISCFTVN